MITIRFKARLKHWLEVRLSIGVVCVGAVFSVCTPAWPVSVIKVTNGEWPPYQSKHSPHFGAASHAVTLIFKEENIGVSFDFVPNFRALQMTKAGHYDATFLWSYSDKRAQDFEFSSPLFSIEEVLMFSVDHPLEWQSYEQLADYRLGVGLGYYYGEEFEQANKQHQMRLQTSTSEIENLSKLLDAKVDVIIATPEIAMTLARQHYPDRVDKLRVLPKVVHKADYHVLFSKRSPQRERWKVAFESGYRKLREQKMIQKILKKALSGDYDPRSMKSPATE